MRAAGWLFPIVVLQWACGDTRSCTEISCIDTVEVVIAGPEEAWVAGSYTLDLRLAREHACTFTLPSAALAAGERIPVACAPELGSDFSTAGFSAWPAPCPPTSDAGDAGCRLVDYRLEIRSEATPSSVSVRLAAADQLLLEETRSVEYALKKPREPEFCGPTCQFARVELTLVAP